MEKKLELDTISPKSSLEEDLENWVDMTEQEFESIEIWDILSNNVTGEFMVVTEKKDDEYLELTSMTGFNMAIPKKMVVKEFSKTSRKFIPDYKMINHIIELLKKYDQEKPNIFPNIDLVTCV